MDAAPSMRRRPIGHGLWSARLRRNSRKPRELAKRSLRPRRAACAHSEGRRGQIASGGRAQQIAPSATQQSGLGLVKTAPRAARAWRVHGAGGLRRPAGHTGRNWRSTERGRERRRTTTRSRMEPALADTSLRRGVGAARRGGHDGGCLRAGAAEGARAAADACRGLPFYPRHGAVL